MKFDKILQGTPKLNATWDYYNNLEAVAEASTLNDNFVKYLLYVHKHHLS